MTQEVTRYVRKHPRLVAALSSAAAGVGAAVGGVLLSRRGTAPPSLPDAVELASLTAASVHNAAKGAVIAAVREADRPEGFLVGDTAKANVQAALRHGVDVAPAAIGAVEGALEIAHLVGESPLAAGQRAAAAALQEAEAASPDAAERVRTALAPYLEASAREGTE